MAMISLSIIIAGFTAMASQIILLREFLTVFYGNELSVGFILANWLIGGALGSMVLGRFSDRIRNKATVFSFCQTAIALILPSSVIMIRVIKSLLNIAPGEIVPIFTIAALSFIILMPLCVILGFIFSLGCRLHESCPGPAASGIGRVYALEALGSMAGGILAGIIMIKIFGSLQIAVILSIINLVSALLIILRFLTGSRRGQLYGLIMIAAILAFASLWVSKGLKSLDRYSLKKQWQGYDLLESKDSIYGNITVAREEGQISFFENGLHLYTVPDKFNAEESVHFAMLEHPNPSQVLLIGGGVGGLITEILKHPVDRVDYVELDPLIIDMAMSHLTGEYYDSLKDPRVFIKNGDGRFFVKKASDRYDCIIVRLGDPCTAQLNRYYTYEFFLEAKHAMKKGGVISFGASSSESYIDNRLRRYLEVVYSTLKKAFSDVKVIPGDIAYFLGSDEKDNLTYDYKILMRRADDRRLDIKYVREYYLFSKLSSEKISYIEEAIASFRPADINRDFRPVAYYYYIIFWAGQFRDSAFNKGLQCVSRAGIVKSARLVYAVILVLGIAAIRRRQFFIRTAQLAIAVTGFSMISYQILILLAFQVIYGYMFYKLGILMASFMAGLAFGGLCAVKLMTRLKGGIGQFIIVQFALSLYPFLLIYAFRYLASSGEARVLAAGSDVIFPAMPFLAGILGGLQFALANNIYLGKSKDTGRAGGLNYGLDLLGSCFGAILTAALLIPLVGIIGTCILIAILNSIILLLMIIWYTITEGGCRYVQKDTCS